MTTKEKSLEELAKEIAEKVADQFMKSILSRLVSETIGLRQDVNELKAESTKVWKTIEELTEKIKELADAQRRTEERLESLAKRVDALAEAQRRTEERLESLAKRVDALAEAQRRTEERLNKLVKVQVEMGKQLNYLMGEFANMRGELIETKVAMDINSYLTRRGYDVFHHFPELPQVDVIVERNDFLAIIEICKKCDMRDLEQVLKGAEILEKTENRRPDLLIIYSYTGLIDEKTKKESEKHGVIIETSTRRLVKIIDQKYREKHKINT